MHRITQAAIEWYITREGDLEQAVIEAVEAARADHIYIRGVSEGSSPPQEAEC